MPPTFLGFIVLLYIPIIYDNLIVLLAFPLCAFGWMIISTLVFHKFSKEPEGFKTPKIAKILYMISIADNLIIFLLIITNL